MALWPAGFSVDPIMPDSLAAFREGMDDPSATNCIVFGVVGGVNRHDGVAGDRTNPLLPPGSDRRDPNRPWS